jgi:hypothetical protein
MTVSEINASSFCLCGQKGPLSLGTTACFIKEQAVFCAAERMIAGREGCGKRPKDLSMRSTGDRRMHQRCGHKRPHPDQFRPFSSFSWSVSSIRNTGTGRLDPFAEI